MIKVTNDDRDGARTGEAAPSESGLHAKKEDWIGRQLRRVFDDAVSEPLPDDIMSLLERIDDEEKPVSAARRDGTK